MTHPDPLEIHDHVYGFRASAHVPGCAGCSEAAERLEAERSELRDALAEEAVVPPADLFRARRRPPWAHLAAAAALLAGLIWLLVPPPTPSTTAAQAADDAIPRLVVELKGPSPLRREIALAALKAYGAQAHAALVAGGVDAAIADAFKTPSADDVEKEKILDALKMDWDFVNVDAAKILDALLAVIRLPATISDEARESLAGHPVSFRVKDLVMKNVLKLFFSQFRLDYYVLDGRLHIGPPRPFMTSRLPIRLGTEDPAAAALAKDLAADDFDVRGRAIKGLRRLGFGAEAALWKGLDHPDLEAAARAAELLRTLYTPVPRGAPVPDAKRIDLSKPVTESFENAPLTAAVDTLRERLNVNVHITGITRPDEYEVMFKCRELPAHAALRLMLAPLPLAMSQRDGVVLVSPPLPEPEASPEEGPFWADPETARRLNAALADLDAPGSLTTVISLAGASIGPLRAAIRILPEPSRSHARARLLRIYKELDLRLADDPTRSYLASVSPGALEVLDRHISGDIQDETLPALLGRFGVTVRSDQIATRAFSFKVERVSIRAILDALTRTSPDLDWRMEGETVVLDTLGNIRAAAER